MATLRFDYSDIRSDSDATGGGGSAQPSPLPAGRLVLPQRGAAYLTQTTAEDRSNDNEIVLDFEESMLLVSSLRRAPQPTEALIQLFAKRRRGG